MAQINKIVKAKDLQLADVIKPKDQDWNEYNNCTVKQIKDGIVYLFRPFVHTADFSHTAGVICYIGIEEYSVSIESSSEWVLLSRKALQ